MSTLHTTPCPTLRRQRGFSLVELMVAATLGLIMLAGTMTMFGVTIRGNTELLATARLNGELGSVGSIMANDIRRAGYSNGLVGMFPAGYDLFINSTAISGTPSIPVGGCVLYSYDFNRNKIGGPSEDDNGNGALDAVEDLDGDNTLDMGDDGTTPATPARPNEWYGFRFNSNDGSISMRKGCADPETDANCATDCTAGTWEAVTDPNTVRITGLSMNTTGSKCINVSNNQYWVTTSTTATTFPCPTASGGTAPGGTTGYLYSSGAYTAGTPTALASGHSIVEVRHINLVLTGCLKDPRDTNNNCVVDTGEDFSLYSGRQEFEVKVRNNVVRRIP